MARWTATAEDLYGVKDAIVNVINSAVENGAIKCDEEKIQDIRYKIGEIVGFLLEMELN